MEDGMEIGWDGITGWESMNTNLVLIECHNITEIIHRSKHSSPTLLHTLTRYGP